MAKNVRVASQKGHPRRKTRNRLSLNSTRRVARLKHRLLQWVWGSIQSVEGSRITGLCRPITFEQALRIRADLPADEKVLFKEFLSNNLYVFAGPLQICQELSATGSLSIQRSNQWNKSQGRWTQSSARPSTRKLTDCSEPTLLGRLINWSSSSIWSCEEEEWQMKSLHWLHQP